MSKKGKSSKKKGTEKGKKTTLSEILPRESLDLLEKLKKELRKKENKGKYTKQGIKRLENVKKRKKRRSGGRDK